MRLAETVTLPVASLMASTPVCRLPAWGSRSAVEAIFVRVFNARIGLAALYARLRHVIHKLLLVLAGGFCGAMTRYLLAAPLLALTSALPGAPAGFPYDTLLINLSGAFLIGLLFGAFEHGAPISPDLRLALGVGFLGAYTTFSSFVVGAASQLERGQSLVALLYLCGALCGGVALAFGGFTLAGRLIEWRRAASLRADAALDEPRIERGWEGVTPDDRARAEGRAHAEPVAGVEGSVR